MSRMLHPFADLARMIENKNCHLKEVSGVIAGPELQALREILRRLKSLQIRKSSNEASTIRPLLLDIQGVSREDSPEAVDIFPFGRFPGLPSEKAIKKRIDRLMLLLNRLYDVCTSKRGGLVMDGKKDFDPPPALMSDCLALDPELFHAQYDDWYTGAKRQSEMVDSGYFDIFPESIRRAEVNLGVLKASLKALEGLQERLQSLVKDRTKRFDALKEMVEEVCERELDLRVILVSPPVDAIMRLPETKSQTGVFGAHLEFQNEILPIG